MLRLRRIGSFAGLTILLGTSCVGEMTSDSDVVDPRMDKTVVAPVATKTGRIAPDRTPSAVEADAPQIPPTSLGSAQFRISPEALVRDEYKGLSFSHFVKLDALTHAEATLDCEAQGMRLPTHTELRSLLTSTHGSKTTSNDCLLPASFGGHRCGTLLSSTEVMGSDDHLSVSFASGADEQIAADEAQSFICVK